MAAREAYLGSAGCSGDSPARIGATDLSREWVAWSLCERVCTAVVAEQPLQAHVVTVVKRIMCALDIRGAHCSKAVYEEKAQLKL